MKPVSSSSVSNIRANLEEVTTTEEKKSVQYDEVVAASSQVSLKVSSFFSLVVSDRRRLELDDFDIFC